jgi:hypothetical protein
MKPDLVSETSALSTKLEDHILEKTLQEMKPRVRPPNKYVLAVKSGTRSVTFEGVMAGVAVEGSLGPDGIKGTTGFEMQTGQLESNALETELFQRIEGALSNTVEKARW